MLPTKRSAIAFGPRGLHRRGKFDVHLDGLLTSLPADRFFPCPRPTDLLFREIWTSSALGRPKRNTQAHPSTGQCLSPRRAAELQCGPAARRVLRPLFRLHRFLEACRRYPAPPDG